MRLAPHNLEMKLALAKAYQDAGRKADSRRQLQEIVQQRVNPSHASLERHVQEKAQKMLSK
jgi:hypothetical protein